MSAYDNLRPDFSKGLVTAILQHHVSKDILMVGYMDQEAFEKTKEDGVVWFFSRSRNRLWKKGESSAHYQYVKSMFLDCDQDALLIVVDPAGPTCHRNTPSCFDLPGSFSLKEIEAVVRDRAVSGEEKSYTSYLLAKGMHKIAKKFGEESFEVVIAAMNNDKAEVANEAADLLYHLGVLLHAQGVSVAEVEDVLLQRHEKKNNLKKERGEIEKW